MGGDGCGSSDIRTSSVKSIEGVWYGVRIAPVSSIFFGALCVNISMTEYVHSKTTCVVMFEDNGWRWDDIFQLPSCMQALMKSPEH